MSEAPQFLSVSAFAKTRGVTDRAIRKRIQDGTLKPALVGRKLNATEASRLLDANTTKGSRVTPTLKHARLRRLRAEVALLQDRVDALQQSLIPPPHVQAIAKLHDQKIADAARKIADLQFPSDLAGLDAKTVRNFLDDNIRAVLTDIADGKYDLSEAEFLSAIEKLSADTSVADAKEPPANDLSTLSSAALQTLSNNLKARFIELRRAFRRGEFVRIQDWNADFDDACVRFRTKMLAIPAKLTLHFPHSAAELRATLRAEIEEAIAELEDRPI